MEKELFARIEESDARAWSQETQATLVLRLLTKTAANSAPLWMERDAIKYAVCCAYFATLPLMKGVCMDEFNAYFRSASYEERHMLFVLIKTGLWYRSFHSEREVDGVEWEAWIESL